MVLLWKLFVASFAVSTVFAMPPATTKAVVFKKDKIILSGKTIVVEISRTQEEHEQGLMFRKSLAENEGMLFIFGSEETRYFWMKNTYIDLSIGYFDRDKTLVDIQDMKASSLMESRPKTYPSAKPAMYALEMNRGWFSKNKISIGHKFKFLSQ